MPVYVVSDLHGAADALDEQVPPGASLLLLGDLINFIDYFSMTGILTEVFSVATVAAVLPDPTYVILGNVDNPGIVATLRSSHPQVRDPDGQVVAIDGERFGFVGGALPTPMHVAGEISEAEMRAKVENLGECDVVCSHIPPVVPELCFDTIARKPERGSKDLLEYIKDVQPRRAYFGHLHQPLISAMRIGRTLCVNVGYFRSTRRAWEHIAEEEPGGA